MDNNIDIFSWEFIWRMIVTVSIAVIFMKVFFGNNNDDNCTLA